MRVAVDARHLGRGRGVARYLESMLAALASRQDGIDWVAVTGHDGERFLPEGVSTARSHLPGRLSNAGAALAGRPRLDRTAGGADAVWIPAPAPVAWSSGVPAVLTVHDISWEQRPGDFTPYERFWHAVARPRRVAERSARIVCVSESTRSDLLAAGWPVDPEVVEVIPEAPAIVPAVTGSADRGRYLLYVGVLEPRKGIDTLAEAYRGARARGLSLPLLVVGEGRMASHLSGQPGVELLGPVGDSELADLYAGAVALVVPSLLEGFGLPAVEAASCGVPTVGSDLPAMRETLGNSLLATAPGDAGSLGEAIFRISTDTALRDRLGAEARQATAGLSWDESAGRLVELLREAAGDRRG